MNIDIIYMEVMVMAKKTDSSRELLRELDIKKEDLIEDIKKDIK